MTDLIIRSVTIEGLHGTCFYDTSSALAKVAFYIHCDADQGRGIYEEIRHRPRPLLVAVEPGVSWWHDMSPWPAPRTFAKGDDFTGGADAHLARLVDKFIPSVEEQVLGGPAKHRGLIGYSLAGLFAVYSLLKCDAFDLCGSMSGSLWFDNFLDYFSEHKTAIPGELKGVYLAVGEREKRTRNARMKTVEDCTEKIQIMLEEQGIPSTMVICPGGHFDDVPRRIADGIEWLLRLL